MEYSSTEALNLTSDRFDIGEDESNSSKGRIQNGLHHHQYNGIIVPLDDASTSSAPADFQRFDGKAEIFISCINFFTHISIDIYQVHSCPSLDLSHFIITKYRFASSKKLIFIV